jgi:alanine transaminase
MHDLLFSPRPSAHAVCSPPLPCPTFLQYCNIGNPQELEQPPITFFRQVLALCNWPDLLRPEHAAHVSALFPPDAVARARHYMRATGAGGMGAYTHSQGIPEVRREVAASLAARDGGVNANADDLFLTDGASPAAVMVLRALIRDKRDGIMVPVPQYPLYSGTIALNGGDMVKYYLREEKCWALEVAELERSLAEARARGVCVRAIVAINPGNPTGNVMSEANMREVAAFAARHGLVLLADEVYQANVWAPGKAWVSFKRVAAEMGLIDPSRSLVHTPGGLQLASIHSTSKGFTGECGRRGGYLELVGFDEGVRGELYKLASLSLCSNTMGQLLVGLQCNPPAPGEPSHARYVAERDAILASLRRRAQVLIKGLNALEGASCQTAEGAMYAFPTITLPPGAVRAAAAAGKAPDAFYCLALLDETGVVVVPGSGFEQREGTFHFRCTILPPEADMDRVVGALGRFHAAFLRRYQN